MSAFGVVQDVYLSNFVVLSMVCVLTAVVRSPLLSVVLVLELNGNMTHLLGLAFCSIMAYFICMALNFEPIYDILLKRMLNKRVVGKGVNDKFTMFDIKLGYENCVSNKKIKDIEFPKDALIAEVDSNGEKYVPNGDSVLKTGDIENLILKQDYDDKKPYYFDGKFLYLIDKKDLLQYNTKGKVNSKLSFKSDISYIFANKDHIIVDTQNEFSIVNNMKILESFDMKDEVSSLIASDKSNYAFSTIGKRDGRIFSKIYM